jgi:hypothetical protein
MGRVRLSTTFAVLAACVALTGCMGRDESEPSEPPEPSRVDSATDFTGEERQVAQVVEDFEAAVLADDVETICRDLLAVEENHGYDEDNGGFRYCVKDPANQPSAIAEASGGAGVYDLVVDRVKRDEAVHGRDRYRATTGSGADAEEFYVQSLDGVWRITARDMSVDGDSTRLAGEYDCDDGGHTELGVSYAGPLPRTNDPREAILEGPFGDKARNALEDGGSLTLDSVFYRPDYHFMYVLADEKGKILVRFPVGVFGPRELDALEMTFCRNGKQSGVII